MDNQNDPPKRKRGRPKKGEIVEKTTGSRGKVGRPKGDASIINEYKARMLASPKSRRVLDSIFDAAVYQCNNQVKLLYESFCPCFLRT